MLLGRKFIFPTKWPSRSLILGEAFGYTRAILARQCRFPNLLLFDPSDPWNSKNFSLHGVPENQLLRNELRLFTLSSFSKQGLCQHTERHEVGILLCSKVRWGRKCTKFWKLHCLTKIALGSRHLTQNWWSWCHFVGKRIFHIMKQKSIPLYWWCSWNQRSKLLHSFWATLYRAFFYPCGTNILLLSPFLLYLLKSVESWKHSIYNGDTLFIAFRLKHLIGILLKVALDWFTVISKINPNIHKRHKRDIFIWWWWNTRAGITGFPTKPGRVALTKCKKV